MDNIKIMPVYNNKKLQHSVLYPWRPRSAGQSCGRKLLQIVIIIVNIIINHYDTGGLAAPAMVAGAGLLAGVVAGAGVVGVGMASFAASVAAFGGLSTVHFLKSQFPPFEKSNKALQLTT